MVWLPPCVTEQPEFLDPYLKKIRDYVKQKRGEDIAESLHVYEERYYIIQSVLKQKNLKRWQKKPLIWKIISVFQDETAQKEYEINKQKVLRLFLRGWLEERFWRHGNCKKQVIHRIPKGFMEKLHHPIKNHFFCEEPINFSVECLKNLFDKYLDHPPKQRTKRVHIIPTNRADSTPYFGVFIDKELNEYIIPTCTKKVAVVKGFSKVKKKQHQIREKRFEHAGDLIVMNFLVKNCQTHAALANCISWQIFLHSYKNKGETVDKEKTYIGRQDRLFQDAINDEIEPNTKTMIILEGIANGNWMSDLDHSERKMVEDAAEKSPKIKLLLRYAQLANIRREKNLLNQRIKSDERKLKNQLKLLPTKWKSALLQVPPHMLEFEWSKKLNFTPELEPRFANDYSAEHENLRQFEGKDGHGAIEIVKEGSGYFLSGNFISNKPITKLILNFPEVSIILDISMPPIVLSINEDPSIIEDMDIVDKLGNRFDFDGIPLKKKPDLGIMGYNILE